MPSSGSGEYKTSLSPWIAILTSFSVHLLSAIMLAVVFLGGGGQGGTSTISFSIETGEAESETLSFADSESIPGGEPEELTSVPSTSIPETPIQEILNGIRPISMPSQGLESGQNQAVQKAVALGASVQLNADGTPSPKSKAKFYGAEIAGDRFVFVIDSSRSMMGDRWDSLRAELIRCIRGLSPDQKFFIISFDSEPHPMFGKKPSDDSFLPPSERDIRRVSSWLRGISLGHSTLPASSIGIAMELEPDAILLLSDGEIKDNTIQQLRFHNRTDSGYGDKVRIPIHTFLLHSPIGYETLATIANENDGVFTPILLGQRQ